MPLTLYHFNNSVCSQKIRMVLREKGVDNWESVEVDLFTGKQFDPEYLKLNPKGVVPTLVHDGKVVTESTLIAEYLDEVFPDPPMPTSGRRCGSIPRPATRDCTRAWR